MFRPPAENSHPLDRFMLQSRWSQNLLTGICLLVLAFLGWWGWTNGLAASRSKTIIKDAQAIQQAFDHFHADQNRYPTSDEFLNNDVMRAYLTNFPPQTFPNKVCQKTYDYYSQDPQTYQLRICLPKSVGAYKQGWNTLVP